MQVKWGTCLSDPFTITSMVRIPGEPWVHIYSLSTLMSFQYSWAQSGADLEGAIAPPKTYESNIIHHDFVQFGKQHSRYTVQPLCRPLLCHSSVVK